jgi:hypothetical protein
MNHEQVQECLRDILIRRRNSNAGFDIIGGRTR